MKERTKIILTGAIIGGMAVLLTALGNPGNMGFCIACFLRDIAGAMGLHAAGAVQNFRPEIVGLVLGAFLAAVATKEFSARGGSSPMTRFVLGMIVMVGALMFLGCPLRMMLRIAGGDLNAVIALVGFVAGIFTGTRFLNAGFSLNRAYTQKKGEGYIFPMGLALVFAIYLYRSELFKLSEAGAGPGALFAPILISLTVGLLVGVLSQRTRFCTVAASRDAMLFGDFNMLWGFVAVIVVCGIGNAIMGKIHFEFVGQPVAHTQWLWNLIGMFVVGWGSVLLGGCPLRQLILAGEGNTDSAITVLGLVCGAAIAHNFGLASSGAGATANGKVAVVLGLILLAVISIIHTKGENE